MKWVHNSQKFLDRRRELRKTQTKAEEILWFELRNNKLGTKFKRQHSIGGYIADFYCQKYKLIVELNGKIHDKEENREYDEVRREYDEVRDKFFVSLGYKVLRFKNEETENGARVEQTLEKIKSFLV